MVESYNELAHYYDVLMYDVDYENWIAYILSIFKKEGFEPQKILDTACGTGNITIPMSKLGYRMTGVDLSSDMLAIAESKARQNKQNIKFYNQDIACLNINENYDAVLCMCDGVNYIIEEEKLQSYFNLVYQRLEKQGIFIFDISSYNKLNTLLGNNILFEEKDNIYYIWENQFDENDHTLEMHLTFFAPDKGLYRKFEEWHLQKAYQQADLKKALEKAGFSKICSYDFMNFKNADDNSERIAFVAIKA